MDGASIVPANTESREEENQIMLPNYRAKKRGRSCAAGTPEAPKQCSHKPRVQQPVDQSASIAPATTAALRPCVAASSEFVENASPPARVLSGAAASPPSDHADPEN